MAILRCPASVPFLKVRLGTHAGSRVVVALLDTGATMTSVHPDVIRDLAAVQIASVDLRQVGSTVVRQATYYLLLAFEADSESRTFAIEAVAATPASSCQVLIGRDLMSRWMMAWDGPRDEFVASY